MSRYRIVVVGLLPDEARDQPSLRRRSRWQDSIAFAGLQARTLQAARRASTRDGASQSRLFRAHK